MTPDFAESKGMAGKSFSSPYMVTNRVLSTAAWAWPATANWTFIGSSVNCTRALAASEGGRARDTSIGFCGAYAPALAPCSTWNPSSQSVPFPSSRIACDGASRTGLNGNSTRCHCSPDNLSGSLAHCWPRPPVTARLPSQSPRSAMLSTCVSKLHGTAKGAL